MATSLSVCQVITKEQDNSNWGLGWGGKGCLRKINQIEQISIYKPLKAIL